jgi:type II secretory pathway pseudopilin PulG
MHSALTTLALVAAVAVTAIPTSDNVPEDALVQYVSNTASDYEHARKNVQSLMQTGKTDKECRDLATSSKKAIEDDVKADQKILDALPTGDSCKNEGQSLVTSTQNSLAQAKTDHDNAEKKLKKAKAANVDFGTVPYNQLTPGQCGTFFNHASYKKAVDAQTKAQADLDKAKGAMQAAQTANDNAVAAAAKGKLECLCRAKKASDKGWQQVKSTQHKAGLDWKTAHNVECVLDGTPVSKCKVPPEPKVKAPKLNAEAAKLNGSTCKDGLCWKKPVYKTVTTGSNNQLNCGTQSCGKFVGFLKNYGYGPTMDHHMLSTPFDDYSISCWRTYGGDAHWCTSREAAAFTKVDFVEMAKKAKEQQVSVLHGAYVGTACGKWDPNAQAPGPSLTGTKGNWKLSCAKVQFQVNSPPQNNVHPSFVTGNYQYVGGSWFNAVGSNWVTGSNAWIDKCFAGQTFGMCCKGGYGTKVDH